MRRVCKCQGVGIGGGGEVDDECRTDERVSFFYGRATNKIGDGMKGEQTCTVSPYSSVKPICFRQAGGRKQPAFCGTSKLSSDDRDLLYLFRTNQGPTVVSKLECIHSQHWLTIYILNKLWRR